MHMDDAPRIGALTGSVARLIAIETAAASGQFPTKKLERAINRFAVNA